MKFRLAIASSLMLIAVSLNLGAQIDPNQAISELSNLQESLNQSDINERTINKLIFGNEPKQISQYIKTQKYSRTKTIQACSGS